MGLYRAANRRADDRDVDGPGFPTAAPGTMLRIDNHDDEVHPRQRMVGVGAQSVEDAGVILP